MSFEFRKFLEDGATAMPSVSPNIAEIMAKSGVKSEGEVSDEIPNIITEEPAASQVAEVKPEVTAPAATEAVAGTAASVVSAVAPSAASTVTIPEQASMRDWKQELKNVDPVDVLKELGYDDKMVGFFNKWRTDGNIADYIRAVSVDYSTMSPEQLMKHQLAQEYPEFSPEDLEELYQAKVVDNYKLNPDTYSEAEVKRGKLLLTADAKKIREGLTAKQQEYVLSAKPPTATVDNSAQQREAEMNEARDRYTRSLTGNQFTKDLLTNRKLVLGTGDNAFNYEIADPNSLVNILQNPEQYARHVFQEDGTPLVDKQLFIAAAAIDHIGLVNSLIAHGKSLGAKQVAESLENTKKQTGELSGTDNTPLTPAQALARSGVVTSSNRT